MNIDKILDSAYKSLEFLEIPQLIDSNLLLYANDKNELNILYEDINSKYPRVINEFHTILNNIYEQIYNSEVNYNIPNEFLNFLVKLKNTKFSGVEKILEKLQYEEKTIEKFNSISSKFYLDKELDLNETKIIESALIVNPNNISLAEEIIAKRVSSKLNISYDAFCIAIITFIKSEISKKLKDEDIKIIISSSNILDKSGLSNCLGSQGNNLLIIRDELVKDFYDNGNPIILNTIFHEIRHAQQRKMIIENNNFFNEYQINMIKEFIVAQYIDNYYLDNYDNIFYEKDAVFFANEELRMFLKNHNFTFTYDFEKNYAKFAQLNNPQSFKLERILDGVETNLNTLFDEIIKMHPEELETYPKLKYLYKVDENKMVVSKSLEEIEFDFQMYMNDSNLSEEEKRSLQISYNSYLNSLSIENNGLIKQSARKNGFINILNLIILIITICIVGILIGALII